jgi:hypothetical protein
MPNTAYTDGFKNGRTYEQERIIQLLENELGDMRPVESHSVGVYDGVSHAIELIKEKTND